MIYKRFVRDLYVGEEFILCSTLVRYKLVARHKPGPQIGIWYICERIPTGTLERLAHNRRVIKEEHGQSNNSETT